MQTRYSSLPTVRPLRRRSPAWLRVKRWLQPQRGILTQLAEAVVWFAGAVVLRLAADSLLLMWPQLWLLAATVLVIPAAIALCLSLWAPPLSLLVGYRLLLITAGLMLGGR